MRSNFLLTTTALMYVLLACLFSAGAAASTQYSVGILALLLSFLLMWRSPVKAVCLIPLVVHIGPVLRTTLPIGGIFTLGDLYLAMLTLFWLDKRRKSPAGRRNFYWISMCALFTLTLLCAADHKAALLGAIGMIEIALVYHIILDTVRTDKQANQVVVFMGFGVMVSAAMHLYFYSQGVTMQLLSVAEQSEQMATLHWNSATYQKSSHFYASFIASCTVVIVISIRRLILNTCTRFKSFVYWLLVLSFSTASALVQGSRTIIITAVLVVPFMALEAMRRGRIRTGLFLALLPLPVVAASQFWEYLVPNAQRHAYEKMWSSETKISMGERLSMWHVSIKRITDFPKEFLIGIGPEVPLRSPKNPVVEQLMYVDDISTQPTSFHNFFIDIIFQLGVVWFILFIGAVGIVGFRLIRLLPYRTDEIIYDTLFGLVAWLILWNVHATYWSKPVILFAELMALGQLCTTGRFWVIHGRSTTIHSGSRSVSEKPAFSTCK